MRRGDGDACARPRKSQSQNRQNRFEAIEFEDDDVPIVRGDPVSKKKKSGSSIDLGLAIGVLIAAVILAFCCGAACCVYRRRKGDPVAEVNGMEMGEVTVIESAPEATVKAVEVPPPPVEGTPNPVRAEGEMI